MSYGAWMYYDTVTGRLVKSFRGDLSHAEPNRPDGCGMVAGEYNLDTDYYSAGADTVVPRPALPHTVTGTTIQTEPGVAFTVTGPASLAGTADATGTLEFEFSDPGEYTVALKLFPYLDAEVVIHAD